MPIRPSITLLALLLFACDKPSEAPSTAKPGEPAPQPSAPAAAAPAAAPYVIKLGYQKIGTPYLLKHRSEALDKTLSENNAKAEWVEFQTGPALLEAMRAGAVDLGYVGETPPVFAQAGGVPFVYVAAEVPAPAAEGILVPKASKVKSVAELKGKKIALNRGSNVHYLLLRALDEAKLTLKDVEVIYLAPPDARSAFDAGQIDAWVIWDPFYAAAEESGARSLRDGKDLVDNRFFYVARRDFAEQQPKLLAAVLKQYEQLSIWARSNLEESAQILAKSSGIPYEALLRQEKRHVYQLEAVTPAVLAAQQKIADAFKTLDLIPKEIQTKDAFLAAAAYGSGS